MSSNQISQERVIRGRSIHTGNPIEVRIVGDRIVHHTASSEALEDRNSPWISPGFFDIQVNGFGGKDYSLPNLCEEDVIQIIHTLASSGTTTHLPTIVTSSQERFLRNLEVINGAMENYPEALHGIPGIHIEGPYISEIDGPRGAHDSQYIRNPDYQELVEWQAASGNRIKIVTLAPERPGSIAFIEKAVADGVCIALGHTAATPEEIDRAVAAGARLSTHLGNGSHGVLPRLKNYLWHQLANDTLHASIISDGFHLPPAVLNVMLRTKTMDRLVLVSDVALLGGKAPGAYKWGTIDVQVHPDGHLSLKDTEFLAGAGHLLNWDIAHFMHTTGSTLADTIRLCTTNPGALLNLPEVTDIDLKSGSRANITCFSFAPGDTELRIHETITAGSTIWNAE